MLKQKNSTSNFESTKNKAVSTKQRIHCNRILHDCRKSNIKSFYCFLIKF